MTANSASTPASPAAPIRIGSPVVFTMLPRSFLTGDSTGNDGDA
ncbi:hypothetical protein ACFPRL_36005 [Pseudoclavibacter helvolus]